MTSLPFLIALFLLINPVLLAAFRRFDIQLEKLQFWIMVSTGAAWIFSILFLAINPDFHLNPVWDGGFDLLPSLAFSLDRLSGGMILAVSGTLFYLVLIRQDFPASNATITGLGGISVLGLVADSPYTLALVWTGMELFNFWIWQASYQSDRDTSRYPLMVMSRSAAPVILILLQFTSDFSGGSSFLTEWDAGSASWMIAGGLLGFVGWFSQPALGDDPEKEDPGPIYQAWIPGAVGLMVVIRGAELIDTAPQMTFLSGLMAAVLILSGLYGVLVGQPSKLWFAGCGLLVGAGAYLGLPFTTLSWSTVGMLSGLVFWYETTRRQPDMVALGLAGLGILPLPYLPSWIGIEVFRQGLVGVMLAMGWGLFLGSLVVSVFKNWRIPEDFRGAISLIPVVGSATLLISQLVIAFQLEILSASRDLFSDPLGTWLPLVSAVMVIILGNRLPISSLEGISRTLARFGRQFQGAVLAVALSVKRIVKLISDLMEGDGGLIWALLLGFLLISLISISGGG